MYILGAGTLGEIVLETAVLAGIKVHGFYDDFIDSSECDGLPVRGRFEDFIRDQAAMSKGAFIAIGDNFKRQATTQALHALGVRSPNVIDPKANISPSASMGEGNLVLSGAVIGTKSIIGSGNIIFPGVSITHHNTIGDYCFFSPNSSIGGYTKISDCCKIGMNCVVLPYGMLTSGLEFTPSTVVQGRSKK